MKKGQMEMSFGMIFSIILIIVFLGFAFYGIKTFLGFSDNAKAGKFHNDLQADVDRVWQSSQSSETQDYVVPSSVDYVCFVDFASDAEGENAAFYFDLETTDYGEENMAFYPVEFTGFESKNIEHLDIESTTNEENPLCIPTVNGKVSIRFTKNFGESLVTVSK